MKKVILLSTLFISVGILHVHAQLFFKDTTSTNPIVTDPGVVQYPGAAWIDYDNDGRLDLFAVRRALYHNDGNGQFTAILNSGITLTAGLGTTWADYNNDGFIDCFVSGANSSGSSLYTNNGNGTFTRNLTGPLNDSLLIKGWGSAWGDFNNDSYVDLAIAAAFGPFVNITDSNKLLLNDGEGSFVRIDTTQITNKEAAFTVPTWSDFDNDNDLDLFIGSGPVNGTLVPDNLYENLYNQNGGNIGFQQILTAPLGTEGHDGQVWNWIDYDNDQDLDAFVTNYQGVFPGVGQPNNLYRNDNGVFVKMDSASVGSIVSDQELSLSSTWGDFDNDGDLDCIVTNNAGINFYYRNDYTVATGAFFIRVMNEPMCLVNGSHISAPAGDFDNDGDLDVFISGVNDKALYINSASDSSNGFLNLKLIGTTSNNSAIGAKVRVKSRLNGFPFWQMREVSAQNTFNGMNMLNVHFGFGDYVPGQFADTLIIEWPSGMVSVCMGVMLNAFYEVTEGSCPLQVGMPIVNENNKSTLEIFPNPVFANAEIKYSVQEKGFISIEILDQNGKLVLLP
ncbi:MAG: FG-GAP-like repeat-containing protein, partial [Bacteroidota bacterium]